MTYHGESGYLQLLRDVQTLGQRRANRTGTDTIALFGPQLRFNLQGEFPLITTKKVFFKGVAVELDWMLQGDGNVRYLQENGVKIWDQWAKASFRPEMGYPEGELGPVYGVQWRNWPRFFDASSFMNDVSHVLVTNPAEGIKAIRHLVASWQDSTGGEVVPDSIIQSLLVSNIGDAPLPEPADAVTKMLELLEERLQHPSIAAVHTAVIFASALASDLANYGNTGIDQIAQIIHALRNDPNDRRIILTSWNVALIPDMKLPPCHHTAQFLVDNDGGLTCVLAIRSWDLFLGAPFNIAQYALLTYLLAHVSGRQPKELVLNAGDAHIYVNHIEQVREQCERHIKSSPRLNLDAASKESIDEFCWDQAVIEGYDPHPALHGEVAV